jgi:two-component system, cell cycle sensor histidine kinase and response regulator CckA
MHLDCSMQFNGSSASGAASGVQSLPTPLFCGYFSADRAGRLTAAGGDGNLWDGRKPASYIGADIYDLICPGDREKWRAQLGSALAANSQFTLEYEHEERHFSFTLVPLEGGSSYAVIIKETTECRHTVQLLQHERQLMNAVLENLPGSFALTDGDGRLLRWNAYHRDVLVGKTDEEMIRKDAFEVIHPDDRELVVSKTVEMLRDGYDMSGEVRMLKRGGPDYCWRRINGRRIVVDGNPLAVSVSLDITDRKQAEEALRQSEERFRNLFHGHSAIMLVFDASTGKIVDANQAAADFYGWTIEEFRAMRIHQLNPFPPEVQSGRGEQDESGKTNRFVFYHLLKDGSVRQVDIAGNRIWSGNSELIYAIVNDVTERNRLAALTEFRLKIQQNADHLSIEALLQDALDEVERQLSSPFSFFQLLDEGFSIESRRIWSRRLNERLQDMAEDLRHRSIEMLDDWIEAVETRRIIIRNDFSQGKLGEAVPQGHPPVRRLMFVPVIRGEEVLALLVIGNKPYQYVQDDALLAQGIADIVWNCVARKRAEQSEQKMQSALMHIQKMEIVGQLAGGIAHDFNNMLSVILGNAEMAVEFGEPNPTVLENLNEILVAADRSAKLTGQLLAFARKQPMIPEIINLNEAVEGILDMLRRLIGEEVRLSWKPSDQAPVVRMDPSQIDQILTNLCINSRDAIEGNGCVTIGIEECHIDRASYENGSLKFSGDYVALSVADDGCGISESDIGHVFEPFFTTKEVGKGSGLGLSTVYGIVRQNNGFVEIDSEPAVGTEIKIFLPRYRASDSFRSDPTTAGGESSSKGTILIVEDEPEILNICRTMLEKQGYRLLTAPTPTEALRLVTLQHESIDLLLTDVIMPEMNGRELAGAIGSAYPGLKVLFMSGYAADIVADQGVFDGSNFIRKPFSLKDLVDRVRQALGS